MPGGRSVRFAVLTAAVLFVALSLFGSGCDPCGTCTSTSKPPSSTATPTRTPTATPTAKPPPSVTGTVQGALNPVSGATVTLYEVGNAAPTVATAARVKPEDYGEGATSLGSTTTDSSGNFTIQFTPPASPTLLYLVALGGNAGGGTNSAIGLIGVAGQSSKLPKSVTINELTTVAAEWALAQFIDSTGQIIGAPPSNATGLANAANQAQANLANISTGLRRGLLERQRRDRGGLHRRFATSQLRRPGAARYDCQHPGGVRAELGAVVDPVQRAADQHRHRHHHAGGGACDGDQPGRQRRRAVRDSGRFSAVHSQSGRGARRLGDRAQSCSQRRQLRRTDLPGGRCRRQRLVAERRRQHRDRVEPGRRPGRQL